MKKLFVLFPVIALVAGCETANQTTAATALGGAALGAAVSGSNDRVQGAALGAAAGAVAGTLIGPTGTGTCVYRNAAGQRFNGPC